MDNASPKRALIVGAMWTVGTRWAIRGLGFLNTVIVARLLSPSDYGIVAMAMLLVVLIQAMLDFGANTALLRKGPVDTDEIDSAWTLSVIQGLLIGGVLVLAAPFAAAYFKEPRVEAVLWVFAVCVVLTDACNVGMVLAQKELNFSLGFRHGIAVKVTGVTATIAAAAWLRDYRALVVGVAVGYTSGMVYSYLMHPYRPRWNTRRIADIWAVTKWLMLAGLGDFILRKGDELIAARLGTTREFGLYNVGSDVGQLPTGELGPALLRAFLPVLSTIQDDIARTNQAVLKTVAAVNTIILPMGAGFAAVAWPAVALILGPSWSDAAGYVAAFALAGSLQGMCSPVNTLLVLRGHTQVQSRIVWAEFLVFLAAAALLVPSYQLYGLVWARIAGSLANTCATSWMAHRLYGLPMGQLLRSIARPMLGAAFTYWAVSQVLTLVTGHPVVQLAAGVATGVAAFSAWSLASWSLVGRPEGLETTVLDALAALKRKHQRG